MNGAVIHDRRVIKCLSSRFGGDRGPDFWDIGHVSLLFAATSIKALSRAFLFYHEHEKKDSPTRGKASQQRGRITVLKEKSWTGSGTGK